jgi:hypothetical protein
LQKLVNYQLKRIIIKKRDVAGWPFYSAAVEEANRRPEVLRSNPGTGWKNLIT